MDFPQALTSTGMDLAQRSAGAAASYDEVPYDSVPIAETHPDSLATAAALVGIDAAPVNRCRVLELGCALGANLIPIAASLPGAHCAGIDASTAQIAAGQAIVSEAGLANVELSATDILDLDESFGQFDYIICHGVYSWVPRAVQDKILDVFARNLTEHGVIYLSYNTFPGWHLRGMVREMLCYHARHFTDAKTRIGQSRAMLEFLARSTDPKSGFGQAVREVADFLRPHQDAYIFHEFLEDVNEPLYFHQVVERLGEKDLKYFGESWLPPPTYGLPQEIDSAVRRLTSDPIQIEQYVDFLINRTFRRSMFCRAVARPKPVASADRVPKLWAGALVGPVAPNPDVRSATSETFRGREDLAISTTNPMLKATLVALGAVWPSALSFDMLWDDIRRRLTGGHAPLPAEASARQALAEHLLNLYQLRVVSLHSAPLPLVTTPSARPLASRLARCQARTSQTVVSLRHHTVDLAAFDRLVLLHLDGQNDEAAIVEAVAQAIAQGAAGVEPYLVAASPDQRRAVVRERLRTSLRALARHGLLEA